MVDEPENDVEELGGVAGPPVTDHEPEPPVIEDVEPPMAPMAAMCGHLPTCDPGVSATMRVSALVDLVYEDGHLASVRFDAVQYHVFEQDRPNLGVKTLGVKTSLVR